MNREIREALRIANVKQWEVAKELGVSEYTLVRWLRVELTEEQKKRILTAMEKIRGRQHDQ